MLDVKSVFELILQSAIIMEFSTLQFCKIQLSPTLTYGPTLTEGPIFQFLPIITGPVTKESWDISVFFPITMLPLISESLPIESMEKKWLDGFLTGFKVDDSQSGVQRKLFD